MPAPVICLHGYPGQPSDFAAIGERIGADRQVAALPMPWSLDYPESLLPPAIGLDELCIHLLSGLDRLGNQPAHVIAHDIGGLAAWALAAVQPKAVRSLVILSSPHPDAYRARLDEMENAGFRAYVDELLATEDDAPLPPLPQDRTAGSDEGVRDRLTAALERTRPATLRGLYRGLLRGSEIAQAPALPRVKCPVLLIAGAEDPYFPTGIFEDSRAQCGNFASLSLLDGAGHNPHLTHAGTVAALTQQHITAVEQNMGG